MEFKEILESKVSALNRSRKFTQIPDWLLERKDLTINEKMAYIALKKHQIKDNKIFPSYRRIAEIMACSRRTSIRAIKYLEDKKLIKIIKRKYKSNIIQFI